MRIAEPEVIVEYDEEGEGTMHIKKDEKSAPRKGECTQKENMVSSLRLSDQRASI